VRTGETQHVVDRGRVAGVAEQAIDQHVGEGGAQFLLDLVQVVLRELEDAQPLDAEARDLAAQF
jgi:hypothetical protein